LLYQRDHSWWDGWGNPAFGIPNLAAISVTNNQFPVVFSVNCASGIFDGETVDLLGNMVGSGYAAGMGTWWAETFLRKSDGALAVIGDTRSSSTIDNNHLSFGLFDAVFPGLIPGYGSATVDETGVGSIDLGGFKGNFWVRVASGDGVFDSTDNCQRVPNPSQLDADKDGYGNGCDGDLNNDSIVNSLDLALFKKLFGASASAITLSGSPICVLADVNGDQLTPGFVNGAVTVASPVPVPPALALLLSGMTPLWFRRTLV
jgi:hypothetical protein